MHSTAAVPHHPAPATTIERRRRTSRHRRPELVVSRVDVYADATGWDLELADLERFVCRGRARRGFVEREHAFATGRRLTGFMFGRDALVARLYDKTVEIAQRGVTWLHDLWGDRDAEVPVWRLEFQYRRPVLVEFGLSTVAEVAAGVQDLWRYGAGEWLTLRTPTDDPRPHRWPVDPAWGDGPGRSRPHAAARSSACRVEPAMSSCRSFRARLRGLYGPAASSATTTTGNAS